MIEVVLQHRESGLFLANNGHWEALSREALVFMSTAEAFRFADEADIGSSVRAVVRVQRERHYILMPLLDFSEEAAVKHHARAA